MLEINWIKQTEFKQNQQRRKREEEMYMEKDHKPESTHLVIKGHGDVCCASGTQAHPPQTTKHEQMPLLSLPTDKSSGWVGKHLNLNHRTWAATALSPLLRSLLLDQSYNCFCLFLQRQRQRDEQNLELAQSENSACTKAILILLNSSTWSTAPSALINSGCCLGLFHTADTLNV